MTTPGGEGEPMSTRTASFILYTGPLAWFVQFISVTVMASWPCYPKTERLRAPLPGFEWTSIAVPVLILVCAALAASSALVAWRILGKANDDGASKHSLLDADNRTQFVALWGVLLGLGATIAILSQLVADVMAPRCAA
jgi:hypothetical protein